MAAVRRVAGTRLTTLSWSGGEASHEEEYSADSGYAAGKVEVPN